MTTHCGDSGFSPSGISSYDWSKFECTYPGSYFDISYTYGKEICSSGGRVCFKREQYTDFPGFGCPGIDLCCANYCETVQKTETKTESIVSDDAKAPNYITPSVELFFGILVGLFIAVFLYLVPSVRNWSFDERANRIEYWSYKIPTAIFAIPVAVLLKLQTDSLFVWGVLVGFELLIFVPSVALTVRRLHDISMNGWHCLWCFLPCGAGTIISVLIGLTKGSEQANQYGMPSTKTWFGFTKRQGKYNDRSVPQQNPW